MTLGENLKQLRIERGLLQSDISDLLSIGVSTISAYERDDKKPKHESLIKLSDYYGVTVDYLLGTESSVEELETEFPEGVKVLRRASKELTPEAKDTMIKLMKAFLEK